MEKATILKTVALLDLKMAEMDSLGLTTLKSIYCITRLSMSIYKEITLFWMTRHLGQEMHATP